MCSGFQFRLFSCLFCFSTYVLENIYLFHVVILSIYYILQNISDQLLECLKKNKNLKSISLLYIGKALSVLYSYFFIFIYIYTFNCICLSCASCKRNLRRGRGCQPRASRSCAHPERLLAKIYGTSRLQASSTNKQTNK